jgi:hypothetical protein
MTGNNALGSNNVKRLPFILFAIVFPASLFAQLPNSVICDFERIAIAELDAGGRIATHTEVSKGSLVIGNLNSQHPIGTGNVYSTNLQVLKKTEDIISLAEYPETGGVVLITLFLKTRIVMFSKQYDLNGPFGFIEIGRFKPMK